MSCDTINFPTPGASGPYFYDEYAASGNVWVYKPLCDNLQAATGATGPGTWDLRKTRIVSGATGLQGAQGFTGATGAQGPVAGAQGQIIFNAGGGIAGATGGFTISGDDVTLTGNMTANEGYRVSSSVIGATGSGFTLASTDNGKVIIIDASTSQNLTVGTGVGSVGFNCTVIQAGVGQVTMLASGVALNSANGLKISAQHGVATIFCYATNTFNVAGNLVA